MKLLCFADNHFCEKYSLIQKYGNKYFERIENQLKSLNWLEETASSENCDAVICLGDFFDQAVVTDQELTACQEIKWNNLPHYFIVGNHESQEGNLQFSSIKALETENRMIISQPKIIKGNNYELCFLPYVIESDRKSINDYFGVSTEPLRIIFSHNDIKGIQMGPVMSQTGFEIADIEDSCNLFINGHLHNGQQITKKIINLGNLTGKDFGENAKKYSHNVLILDTDTRQVKLIENPYAFNFYKLEINTKNDLNQLDNLKNQAVVSIKCEEKLLSELETKLKTLNEKIAESRVIISRNISALTESVDENAKGISELTDDHLTKFVECCHHNIENSKILEEELAEICK